jgi:hypothetical protein
VDGDVAVASDLRDAGDFRELIVAANVDRLRTALASTSGKRPAATPGAGAAAKAVARARAGSLLERLRVSGCAPTLPNGTVVVLATGTLDGRAVVVVEQRASDGSHSLHAVEADACAVRRLP